MIQRISPRVPPSEITPESVWLGRRRLLRGAATLGLAPLASAAAAAAAACERIVIRNPGEAPNTWEEITGYNNYYEFSPDKKAVKHLAAALPMQPWTVTVDGEVQRPGTWDPDDLAKRFAQEERVLRLRCVEGWSMVIPWQGFSLCALLRAAQPTSRARYVRFTALHDRTRMLGQRTLAFPWPYAEGLTLAEAMHPLTTLATGLYGRPLPPQNGGPLRLVVPWKYGFKSIKGIVRITLETERPESSWSKQSPEEYGFYANVDPQRAHPRWSQARETRIGELRKRPTLPFNGYATEVAALYAGLDPRTLF